MRGVRCRSWPLLLAATLVLTGLPGCEYMPERLSALKASIETRTEGEVEAWRLGGDVVVVHVAGSPHYHAPEAELEALSEAIAREALERSHAAIGSIAVTFHEEGVSLDESRQRLMLFVVRGEGLERIEVPVQAAAGSGVR
jgi:hypothetical protein